MEFKFQGKAQNGSIKFNDRDTVVKFLESIDGNPITCTIKAVKQVRSLGWNSYYWTVVIPRVRLGLTDVGYDADELDNEIVHEFLKSKFLTKEIYSEDKNEIIKITDRTSKIDNKRFAEYVADIQRWAIKYLHVYIPDPNEGMGIGSTV